MSAAAQLPSTAIELEMKMPLVMLAGLMAVAYVAKVGLSSKNARQPHGRTAHLTPDQIDDLAAFLLSI